MADEPSGRHHLHTGPELFAGQPDAPSSEPGPLEQQATEVLHQRAAETTQVARDAGRDAARQISRRWYVMGLVATSVLSIGISLLALNLGLSNQAASEAQKAQAQSQAEVVDEARTQIDGINDRLISQGKPPVASSDDPTEAQVRLVLARVMEQLPRQPTADQLVDVLRSQVFSSLSSAAREQISAEVARYLDGNRDALQGPPPTAVQLRAAVDEALRRNPPEPGRDGNDGQAGRDGVDGQPGQAGRDGVDGQPGRDGVDGAPGRDGIDGQQGPPGPTCPEGTSLQPVTFQSGQSGLGCVNSGSEPTSEAPAPETQQQRSVAPGTVAPSSPTTQAPAVTPTPTVPPSNSSNGGLLGGLIAPSPATK